MEALSLMEKFNLLAAGASVAIAAVAIGLALAYFRRFNRMFHKTEERVEEMENSVNEMYGAVTKLFNRSESSAAEFQVHVLQLQEVAEHFGKDAELFKQAASQTGEQDQLQPHVNPQPSLESTPPRVALNGKPGKMSRDSLQNGISTIRAQAIELLDSRRSLPSGDVGRSR